MALPDQTQRQQALDPSRSFIVQAPAGSGKTELLVRRILVLLTVVDQPEEIIAITFTRKAAAEMRNRVISVLATAENSEEQSPSELELQYLAQKVLERNNKMGWNLIDHPVRLRVQTIDSLCMTLTRQMPWLSRSGANPMIIEDPEELYRQAATATLEHLDGSRADWQDSVQILLRNFDNDYLRIQSMLMNMLVHRDQWLRYVAVNQSNKFSRRERLQSAWASVITSVLGRLSARFPKILADELVFCADFAARQLNSNGVESGICNCAGLTALPATSPKELGVWKGIATLLVTSDGSWRKQLNKRIGFPAGQSQSVEAKKRMLHVLASLAERPEILSDIKQIVSLPYAEYSDDQWSLLAALLDLLPVAVAELQLVFRNHSGVDYAEVSQRANDALGQNDQPSDLALALDYRIRHILVDEFQDTSHSQFQLLERLTAGWQNGDGHSLFLVGDPMQSIYRFREADVGLFLHASTNGVGSVALEQLTLTVNFRSDPNIVDWINQTFSSVLPITADSIFGSVPYSSASAIKTSQAGTGVTVHPFIGDKEVGEAERVVELIKAAKLANPKASIAVLVRNRSHLNQLIPLLQQTGLKYQGVRIEPLSHRAVIQDLLALTRALLHPFDRVAWLAVLRAPWGGLTLADLLVIAHDSSDCILEVLADKSRQKRLSADGAHRATEVTRAIKQALDRRGRLSLRELIEGLWIELGGPACIDETDLENTDVFFDVLDNLNNAGDLPDIRALFRAVNDLWAQPDLGADEHLKLMTIHAAKGLEFDTVIVPGLGRPPRPSPRRLLLWSEVADKGGAHDLLLAPLRIAETTDTAYEYLQQIDQQKNILELGRLLYVVCTRARSQLHLLGQVKVNKNHEPVVPAKNALLKKLWPIIEEQFRRQEISTLQGMKSTSSSYQVSRLPAKWEKPRPDLDDIDWNSNSGSDLANHAIEFNWAGETARVIGVLVHQSLCQIAEQGMQEWGSDRISRQREVWRRQLEAMAVSEANIPTALNQIEQSVLNVLVDTKAAWILDSVHQYAQNELDLTGIFNGRYQRVIIDRTFVDDHGVRWIVDYKTSTHEGGDVKQFLDQEQRRYREQLELYAQLLQNLDHYPIKLGLYFPLLKGWREWAFQR